MPASRNVILDALRRISLPDGGDLVSRDMVRALTIDESRVGFVLEVADAAAASRMEPVRAAAEEAVMRLEGVERVSVVMTAHGATAPEPRKQAPSLKIGGHPKPGGPVRIAGVDRILAVASGKGGVGKSTVSSNLAVALAKQGRRVGLLDADIHGPSLPRMMGVSKKPASPDGKTIVPLHAHGVTVMSIGLMVDPDQAVVWRGPMMMGALQQMLTQVEWGELDVLIVDLPPGTGDVQLSLCQKTDLTGALIVSTPQDVALIDARRAIAMFEKLDRPVLGLIENMSVFVCPDCGSHTHIFGHGGVRAEAEKIGVPFLGELPLALEVREAGDSGTPAALLGGAAAEAYAALAARLVDGGMA